MRSPLTDAELLARLVSFDTVSRNSNLPLADFLANYLDRPGVRIERLPAAEDGKASLLVWIGPETAADDRGGLVLSGHMDVVPADDRERWATPPFHLTDLDDRWAARGAADMKGFLALATNLAMAADPDRLHHPLVLLFTCDEELGCLGSAHLAKVWNGAWDGPPLPRAAIIGEPTRLSVIRRHKGHLKLAVTYRGISAHSGYPHLGINAVERAADGVAALAALRRALETERVPTSDAFPDAPYAPLNVATIHGGTAINMVPDRCAVEIGIRLLPGMDAQTMIDRVRRAVAPTAASEGYDLEILSESPPMELAADAPIHRFLCDLTGQDGGASVSFATDAGWLQQLDDGVDCAVFGPGDIEVAHKPDEWLPKEDLARARTLLEKTVHHFCQEAA